MISALPYILSILIGYLLIDAIFHKEKKPDGYVQIFLAPGLGLSVSAYLTFASYILLDEFNKSFILWSHLIFAFVLFLRIFLNKTHLSLLNKTGINKTDSFFVLLLLLFTIPVWYIASFYPLGGWDAWSVWNLKAKFLLLGGKDWKNMLDPVLWRSSPHYPLLLPLINVWGWAFSKGTPFLIPMWTGIVVMISGVGLLFAGLRTLTGGKPALLAALLMITSPFVLKLAASQYADILLGYLLLSSILCLINAIQSQSRAYAILAGSFLGFLSFVKPEGGGGAVLIIASAFLMLRKNKKVILLLARPLLMGTAITGAATLIFNIFYAPANQTFINGLVSTTDPATPQRLGITFIAYGLEFINKRWNGLWILLTAGVILGGKNCFEEKVRIIPVFLGLYMLTVTAYYYVNTSFPIIWWLTSTLHRIVFALIPTGIFWIFSLLQEGTESR